MRRPPCRSGILRRASDLGRKLNIDDATSSDPLYSQMLMLRTHGVYYLSKSLIQG